MFAIISCLLSSIRRGFRIRSTLQAEILALRHQLLDLQRTKGVRKLRLMVSDRLLRVWLRMAPKRVPPLLELEESSSARPAFNLARGHRSDF